MFWGVVTFRRVVFFLAVISLCLSVLLANKKEESKKRMEIAKKNLFQKRDEQSPLYWSLLRNHRNYFSLDDQERHRLRKIYKQIMQSPDPEQLEKTLDQYYDWLQSRSLRQRIDHQGLSDEKKLEEVRLSMINREEMPGSVSEGMRRAMSALLPELRGQQKPALFLEFYKTWLDRKYDDTLREMDEAERKILESEIIPVFSKFFGESPENPGIWTKAAILRLKSKEKQQAFEMFAETLPLEQFGETLSEQERHDFEKLDPRQQRMYLISNVIFALSDDFANRECGQSLRTRSFTGEQEKLLGTIFEFFPPQESEIIVSRSADQFAREIMSYLFLPVSLGNWRGGPRGNWPPFMRGMERNGPPRGFPEGGGPVGPPQFPPPPNFENGPPPPERFPLESSPSGSPSPPP